MSNAIIQLAQKLVNGGGVTVPALSGKQWGDLLFWINHLKGYSF